MRPVAESRLRRLLLLSSALVAALVLAAPVSAVPVNVTSSDLANCDVLGVPSPLHELGLGPISGGPFPTNEEIVAFDTPTSQFACTGFGALNTLVTMTNLSGQDWEDVWYVSDPETSITNFDGLVNGQEAFKIDFLGVNDSLKFESLIPDGIFQAGETWEFVIDEYINALGLPASALGSCLGGPPCPSCCGSHVSVFGFRR